MPSSLFKALARGGLASAMLGTPAILFAYDLPPGVVTQISNAADLPAEEIKIDGLATLRATSDVVLDQASQVLRINGQGGTVAAAAGTVFELKGGVKLDGIVRFGDSLSSGTVVLDGLPFAEATSTSEVRIEGGTLRGGTALGGLSSLLYDTGKVSIAAGAKLDRGGAQYMHIWNLQGAGMLHTDGAEPLKLRNGTFSGTISGSSGIETTGVGSLVLSGINTFTGGVRIVEASSISISDNANLGNASNGVYINGSTLQITGTGMREMDRAVTVGPLGAVLDVADAGNTLTMARPIVGDGDLQKLGEGKLVLQRAGNSYRNTYAYRGTLEGNASTIRGNLLNNATVIFNQTTDGVFAGNIDGFGGIIKQGQGDLTIAGRAYRQRWDVAEGKLILTSLMNGPVPINIRAGAALVLSIDDIDGTDGPITGNGQLRKIGKGEWVHQGDASAFTGRTSVEAGTLILIEGKLGGSLDIHDGATLLGHGVVGDTRIMRGAAIKTYGPRYLPLTVRGDLTFEPGSTYEVKAYPAAGSTASDRINVTGTATLAGSVVHVGPEGDFKAAQRYTILTASRLSGRFDQARSNYAYLDASLGYTDQSVILQLMRKPANPDPSSPDPSTPGKPLPFSALAESDNQRAVADALDQLPDSNPLHQYVLGLPAGAPPAAFDSLSGEAHASVTSSLATLGSQGQGLSLRRLRASLDAGMIPGQAVAQAGGVLPPAALPGSAAQPAWAQVVGNWRTTRGDGDIAGARQHTGGVFLGADAAVGAGWRLGGALGFTDSRLQVDDRASKSSIGTYSALVYGGRQFALGAGKLNVLLGAGYAWHDIDTERQAYAGGASQKLKADYGGSTGQLFAELGYAFNLSDRVRIEPFAGLAWSDMRTRGFSESGGSAALNGASTRNDLTTATLGLRADTNFALGKAQGALRVGGGWRRGFGDLDPQARLAFDGGSSFTVAGTPIARNAAFVEFGMDVALSRSATFSLGYDGQFGGGNREHAATAGLRWRF